MKKQAILLVTSALLLSGCGKANSIINQYRKKVGGTVHYSTFVSKLSDAVSNLQSGEFWDLITAGTPKSCVVTTGNYYEEDTVTKATTGFVSTYKETYVETEKTEYDEKNDVLHYVSTEEYKEKVLSGKKVVYDETDYEESEYYVSKDVEINVIANTYELTSNTPASEPAYVISSIVGSMASLVSISEDADSKYHINGTLFTIEGKSKASDSYGETATGSITGRIQVNVDPNDLFVYYYSDMSGVKYTNSDDEEINYKKNVSADYRSVKSKDVKVKMPSLTKFINEDLTIVS